MLTLRRKPREWVVITAPDGHVLRLRVRACESGRVEIDFDDAPRHFEIGREEATTPAAASRHPGVSA